MKHLLNSLLVLTFVSSGSTFKAKLPMRDVAQSHALSKSSLMMFDVLSVAAGSIAGAVGVGFAYPLDSMKTKIQNRAASSGSSDKQNLSFLSIAKDILRNEGVLSLYKGVVGVMLGNALIKACAFTANRWALAEITTGSPTLDQLIVAAAFSGMVTSFFSNPIERVKVLMQSKVQTNFDCDAAGSETKEEDSELQIISHVLKSEGLQGLAFRGLDATLAREIPGYSLYFVGYFTMIHTPLGEGLGPGGPVVMGALAGMFSWLIVFPLDVCKTNLQNIVSEVPVRTSSLFTADADQLDSESKEPNLLSTAIMLKRRHGMGVFVKGMTPKMLQAGVNHSITFYVYDLIVNIFSGP